MKRPRCGECGAPMNLKESRFGRFYGCSRYPDCNGAHGAQANGRPIGVPADRETKQARIEAHRAFDKLWNGPMAMFSVKQQAYDWLASVLGIPKKECQIGRFDKAMCRKVIDAVGVMFEE